MIRLPLVVHVVYTLWCLLPQSVHSDHAPCPSLLRPATSRPCPLASSPTHDFVFFCSKRFALSQMLMWQPPLPVVAFRGENEISRYWLIMAHSPPNSWDLWMLPVAWCRVDLLTLTFWTVKVLSDLACSERCQVLKDGLVQVQAHVPHLLLQLVQHLHGGLGFHGGASLPMALGLIDLQVSYAGRVALLSEFPHLGVLSIPADLHDQFGPLHQL